MGLVYAIGLAQGVALVILPAASSILTARSGYDLSSLEYGSIFLPQVLLAMLAAALGGELGRRLGSKRLGVAGLAANTLSMALLVASHAFVHDGRAPYLVLLLATSGLGLGFGLTVPALNTITARLRPQHTDSAVLILNALLGLGSVLAPLLVAAFARLGFWWGLPLLLALVLAMLLVAAVALDLGGGGPTPGRDSRPGLGIPPRLLAYMGAAALYGICEAMSGNWGLLDMTQRHTSNPALASLALTAFWATVTGGRLLSAAVVRWVPARLTYHALPFLLAGALLLVALMPSGHPVLGILGFALAGLGCSALLPLTISFAQAELAGLGTLVAGGVLSSYQFGFGVAAFGVGPLLGHGLALSTTFELSAVAALGLGVLSLLTLTAGRSRGAPGGARTRNPSSVERKGAKRR